jgi:hypothetical protein
VATPPGATAVSKPRPPHPDAAAPAPVPVTAAQPTGPVDFVPGLPGLGTPPVPPPAAAPAPPVHAPSDAPPAAVAPPRAVAPPQAGGTAVQGTAAASWPDTLESDLSATGRSRKLRALGGSLDRTASARLGLAALAVVLVLVGAGLGFGSASFWSDVPLWSAFATACAVLGLFAFAAAAANRLRTEVAERVTAAGVAGLAAFWVLVVLADVDTDRGFVFTAALACLGGALWIGPRSRA